MANTAANNLPSGDAAVLTSSVRTTKTGCVHFWYHMGGVNPGETPSHTETHTKKRPKKTQYNCVCFAGSLTLYMKPVNGERVKIFSDSLNQGDVWRHGNGNIEMSALVDWQVQCGGWREQLEQL